ncbi:hypothetical protein PT279_01620 [Bifidobacterium sp. ESL0784]|uniref:hypothetical protein n=1 Tax=Bifidobacterium sp. ESL0784 TaxID=2983231 RepID=UPI0023F63508|nr:hypothetical protein [Bifidobacterium sp. ESL0784]MDF7640297.1 hypothetical protein [Bifidobacterium sp. ESL0784]
MTSEHDKQHKHNAKPTKHATIMRGVVAPVFGLLAVLFIVLGTLNMTVWKPAHEVSATASISGTRYVVTDSGMLNLLAKSVNVKVSTQGNSAKSSAQSDKTGNAESVASTCVALGNAKDATGWLAGQDYTRVTGLDGWKALSTKTATGPKLAAAQGDGEVAFKDSDMWTSVKCGDSAITMNLDDVKNDQVLIVDMGASAGKSSSVKKSAQPSVSVTMHWVRDQVPNHAMPFFIAAGVCVVLTILSASIFAIMANESFKRKRAKRREVREKAKAEEVSISEAMTGSIAVLKTSLTHSSHNHRPSHKIQPSDLAGSGASSSAENGGAGAASNGSLLSAGTGDGLSDAEVSAPSIIDPTRRNLVADMQMSNDTDEDAEDETDTAEETASDSHQVLGGPSAGQTGETETDQPQGSETEDSSEQAAASPTTTDTAFTQAHEDADTANTDENHQDMSRFARHRGKPEQESESDAAAPLTTVGRHSRHAAASDASDDYLRSADSADNRDGSDKRNDAGDRDDANNANGREGKGVDFRTASVAVSLEHQKGDSQSGNAEHANTQNGEARTASSADELIDKNHAQAETTVISADDLRAYFARFSSETSDGDTANSDTTNGEAGPAQADSEATGEASNVRGDGETE